MSKPYDMVRQLACIIAGGIKVACYQTRDEEGEWGPRQFHMTSGNTVMAVMGPEAAKLFARFCREHAPPDEDQVDVPLNLEETAWLIHSLIRANDAYHRAVLADEPIADPVLRRMLVLHDKLGRANDKLMGKI